MELINNLKRDLIAILTSNGGKSTLSQIKIYFDKELGVNIMNSFRELGIKSNREFLERMSDIIVFRPIGLSDFEVFKKFHEDSKHMDNLTISQNEKRKAKKRAKRQVVTNNR
jgi:ATP-dependent Clp protease ATP-binding subunit ClpA